MRNHRQMSSYRVRSHSPVDPAELAMLQRVLDEACESRNVSKKSCDARNMAALLVELYAHGVRQEHQLSAMVH